jgi:calcineurin-like phosphoesterase family protein
MIHFSADFHLHHFNVLKYCNRPFQNVAEMNETIIKNVNSVAIQSDTLYHLGDFTMTDNYKIIADFAKQIQCKKVFICGNHDKRKNLVKLKEDGIIEAWYDTYGLFYKDRYIWLSHYSHRVWDQSHKGSWHLFGHTHNKMPSHGLSFDAGVDSNNYKPYSFDDVEKKMKELGENK